MAINYLDRGKTRLEVGDSIAIEIGKALRSVTKNVYKEEKRKRRVPSYRYIPTFSGPTLKEAVFDVLEQAVNKATAGGTYSVSARDLYYEVRPLVASIVNDKDLEYNYFSQTLLTQYQEEYGEIAGLTRDPRGVLIEPHTGKVIPLGTSQVAKYQFPDWTYNKILYIEKKGVAEQLKPSKLAERYDMAIIAAEGYATEAARTLLESADTGEYHFYVFHDADPYGYNIAHTLREETRRMPGYSVDVQDIGLHLQEAHEMGLQMEPFVRKNDIPYRVSERLSEFEETHFIGERVSEKVWRCNRIEINAIPVPDRAAYIERKLKELGAPGKVIPPDDELPELSKEKYESCVDNKIENLLDPLLSVDEIKETVRDALRDRIKLDGAREWIEEGFKEDDSQRWSSIVENKIKDLISDHDEEIEDIVRNEIQEAIREEVT